MQVSSIDSNVATATAKAIDLRLFQPKSVTFALGLAVEHLMSKPAFARLPFGEWARVLAGQINRKQFCFAVDPNSRVRGFAGWALTDQDKAEAWVSGRHVLSSLDSRDGDCVIFNLWSAETAGTQRFMLHQVRRLLAGKQTIYFRRHNSDGRTRSVKLSVVRGSRDHVTD